MFANKIMIWPFKQSREVCYAVPVYKYLMQMEEIGPWNFGQFAEIFQREKIVSAQSTLFIWKNKRTTERRKKLCFTSLL